MSPLKVLVAAAIACSSTAALAADWRSISTADNNGARYEGDIDSFAYGKNNSGEAFVKILGRQTKANGTMDFATWYVTLSDCNDRRGKLVVLDLRGKFLFNVDFVSDGGSVASEIAGVLCKAHLAVQKANDAKSEAMPTSKNGT
jgi:hypothetical protein